MKQTINRLASQLGALMLGYSLIVFAHAGAPQYMTYQGHLLDANGDPVGKTLPVNKIVQFQVYDAEEDGDIIWGEEQVVTVDNGYFSVVLGEGTNLHGESLFQDMEPGKSGADDRYVGLRVDGVDITPRLRLLTVPYAQLSQHAVSAKNSHRAVSAQSADVLDNNSTARAGLGFVPVGGIIMWNKSRFPRGWAVCNGSNGTPNLRGRFVMGVGNSSGRTPDNDKWSNGNFKRGATGGASHMKIKKKHMPSHAHSIHNKNLGSHNHGATATSSRNGKHQHRIKNWHRGGWHHANVELNSHANLRARKHDYQIEPSGDHAHTITVSVDQKGLGKHNHGMSAVGSGNWFENRPPFYALYYIQRIQ